MKALNDAAIARAEAVWNANQVHKTGEVPNTPTTPYLALSVGSGSADNYDLAAQHGSRGHRLVGQAVGKSVNEVAFAVEKCDAAFLDYRLTVAGLDCSPCVPEVSSPIIRDPDAGVLLSVTLTYTFQTFPKE